MFNVDICGSVTFVQRFAKVKILGWIHPSKLWEGTDEPSSSERGLGWRRANSLHRERERERYIYIYIYGMYIHTRFLWAFMWLIRWWEPLGQSGSLSPGSWLLEITSSSGPSPKQLLLRWHAIALPKVWQQRQWWTDHGRILWSLAELKPKSSESDMMWHVHKGFISSPGSMPSMLQT